MGNEIHSEEYKGYTINIFQDDNPMSPREWDNLGTMMCFHKEYELGDKHTLKSEDFAGWEEVKAYLINEMKAVIILPLYLYDHSGLRIKVGSFNGLLSQGHAEWDTMMVGFIYVTRSKILEEYSAKRLTPAVRGKVVKVLEDEVDTYDQYLRGSVYGFVINKPVTCDKCGHTEQDTLESVWGYYGDDLEPIITECKEIIDSELKGG